MKVVILAGGFGTRINEETTHKPKPMIEIGDRPILWHIMKIYSHYGFNDFVICLGYKSEYVKNWFNDYYVNTSDVTFDLENNTKIFHKNHGEKWKITLIDTGLNTMTGSRVDKIKEYIGNETFMLTYGDGLSNIDIKKLVDFHKEHKKVATVTSVYPEGRFGVLTVDENSKVNSFSEKTDILSKISGGFFVLEPEVFSYLDKAKEFYEKDQVIFEKRPLEELAKNGELKAFHHEGFWKPMDTLRDKIKLEELWSSGDAPWKVWDKK